MQVDFFKANLFIHLFIILFRILIANEQEECFLIASTWAINNDKSVISLKFWAWTLDFMAYQPFYRLFNAQSIFIQINSSISNNSN